MSPVLWPWACLCACALLYLYTVSCDELGLKSGDKNCTCTSAQGFNFSSRGKIVILYDEWCTECPEADLRNNSLRNFPDFLPPQLKKLDVSTNNIAETGDELRYLSSLEQLDVSHNRLVDLKFLPEKCKLRLLIGNDNLISNLTGPLQNCTKIVEIRLGRNKIAYIADNYFKELIRLKLLDLSNNPNLVLRSEVFEGLQNLRYLSLKSSEITVLPANLLYHLPGLQTLDLSYNNISTLPRNVFQYSLNLEQLFLQGNCLQVLPSMLFKKQELLIKLVLDDNELSSLPDDLFVFMTQLEELSMQGNRLTTIPAALGRFWGPLRVALFNNNLITAPTAEQLRPLLRPGLKMVDLEGNPLRPEALALLFNTSTRFLASVDERDCACGTIHLELVRDVGPIHLCIYLPCGDEGGATDPGGAGEDWLAAVSAVNADRLRYWGVQVVPRPRRSRPPRPGYSGPRTRSRGGSVIF